MLSVLQKRKKELRSELSQIEKQIFDLETTYLEETKEFGNIFTGWTPYQHLSTERVKAKKAVVSTEDRHFSLSSVTSPASRKDVSKKAILSRSSLQDKPSKRRKSIKNLADDGLDSSKAAANSSSLDPADIEVAS